MADLNENLATARERFQDAVRQESEAQFDDLTSEVLEIEASLYGRLTLQLGNPDAIDFEHAQVELHPGSAPLPSPPRWAYDLGNFLKQFHKLWGAGDGVKAAAGGNGHQIVLTVGHAFGKKFKPWEAACAANNIGKLAKVGGALIAVGLEAYGVFADERAAVKAENARAERRRNITQEILGQADGIVADALRNIRSALDEKFRPEFQRIDEMANQVRGARTTRSDLRDRLDTIRATAEATLAELAGG